MKVLSLIIAILGLELLYSNLVVAEQLTVGQFKKSCLSSDQALAQTKTTADALEMAKCWGYLDGVTDGMVTAMTIGKGPKLFCLPENGVSMDGSVRMVRDFLNAKKIPDDAPVRGMIGAAYINYFPCSDK